MDNQAEEHRIGVVRVDVLVFVRFLPEVKVRRYGVLEEMDDQIADQHERSCCFSAQFKTLRNHLDQRGSQHDSSTQGYEVAKITALPVALHDDRSAEDVCGGGGEAQKNAGEDWTH